jgi:hypothetical protein
MFFENFAHERHIGRPPYTLSDSIYGHKDREHPIPFNPRLSSLPTMNPYTTLKVAQ